MSGDISAMIAFGLCILIVGGVLLYIIREQRKEINMLTDRLMARSLTEFRTVQGIKEDDVSPVREDDPKGWYDH